MRIIISIILIIKESTIVYFFFFKNSRQREIRSMYIHISQNKTRVNTTYSFQHLAKIDNEEEKKSNKKKNKMIISMET